MHALIPILEMSADKKELEEIEAKAVAEASASADSAFQPSPNALNASSAAPLLEQVDGHTSLKGYEGKDSVYVGRSVPVSAGGNLTVPITVLAPGSVVEYTVENKSHDIGFGITAERDDGITVVAENTRCEATAAPVNGKFLVGNSPCLINFKFSNDYSWMREKVISYKITVTPPSKEALAVGRRRRAKACLKAVEDDLKSAEKRLTSTSHQKSTLEAELLALQKQLEEKKKSLEVCITGKFFPHSTK
jgi:hypothetical protein